MKKYFTWEYAKRLMDIIQFLAIVGGIIFTIIQINEISYNQLNLKNDRTERYYDKLNSGVNRDISIVVENKGDILLPKGKFTTDQLDDYIDDFHGTGQALNENLLSEDKVCSDFYDITSKAYNNTEIKNYIKEVRETEKDNTFFADFDTLYDFISSRCQ